MLTKFPTADFSIERNIKSSASCYPDSHLCPVTASTIVNFRLEKSCIDVWQQLKLNLGTIYFKFDDTWNKDDCKSQIHPYLTPEIL